MSRWAAYGSRFSRRCSSNHRRPLMACLASARAARTSSRRKSSGRSFISFTTWKRSKIPETRDTCYPFVIEKVEHTLECFQISVDVADDRKARLSCRSTGGKQVLSAFGGKLSWTPDGIARPAVGGGFTVLYGGPMRVGSGWHRGLDKLGSSPAPRRR